MVCLVIVLLLIVPASPSQATPIDVLLIGDSLTLPAPRNSPPPDRIYGSLLEDWLGGDYAVENIGRGGWTLAEWERVASFDVDLSGEPPDIASILLGSNDSSGAWFPALPVATYGVKLRRFVYKLSAWGVETIVLMSPPLSKKSIGKPQGELLAGYRVEIQELCVESPNLICGPDLYDLLDPAVHMRSDGVHLNISGHAATAAALYETILAIPEPGTGLLVGAGLVVLVARSRHRRRADARRLCE